MRKYVIGSDAMAFVAFELVGDNGLLSLCVPKVLSKS